MNKRFYRIAPAVALGVAGAAPVFAQTEGTITVDAQEEVSDAIDSVNGALGLLVPAAFIMVAITLLIRQTRKKLNG